MTIKEIEKNQELLNALADGLNQQNEIITGLKDSCQAYLEFLEEQLHEFDIIDEDFEPPHLDPEEQNDLGGGDPPEAF